MQELEDRLFARFQRERDPEDLARVYDLLAPRLLRVARHLTPSSTEAEDLLQATFVAAIESADRYREQQAVRSWLLGILANRARLARWYGAREPDPERLDTRESADPARSAEDGEFSEWLDGALRELPTAFRQTLSLRLRQGMSTREIAGTLRRPVGTIRSRLTRGMAVLRRGLPAGFASLVVILFGTRALGLDGVRRRLLTRVSPMKAGKAGALGLTTGVLLVKPFVASAVTLLVLIGLWNTLAERSPRRPESIAPAGRTSESLRQSAEKEVARAELRRDPLPARDPSATRVATALARPEVVVESVPAGLGDLQVTVLRKTDQTPAPGAVVLVDVTPQSRSFPLTLVAEADENGVARFQDLPAGMSQARTLRGSRASAFVPTDETGRVELYLFEGISVRGEVLDELERPVPGAEIWLSDRWEWNRGAVVARADRAGRFLLESIFDNQFLSARARGRASSHLYRVRGRVGATRELVIRLRGKAGRVRGTVFDSVDSGGEPMEHAQVLVGSDAYDPRFPMEDGTLAPAAPPILLRTGPAGGFETDFVEPGTVTVQARGVGFAPAYTTVEVRAGETVEVELRLDSGVTLAGTVRDHEGRGVPMAEIRAVPVQSFGTSYTTSDASGDFVLEDLATGAFLAAAAHRLQGSDEERFEARAGESLRWDPELDARAPGKDGIHGVLLDGDGMPLERFMVIALIRDDDGPWDRVSSKPTGRDGAFLVEVFDDRERTLWVQGPGGFGRFPERVLHGVVRGSFPLEIVVGGPEDDTGKITGAVVDEGGAAADDARLEVWHDGERIWREFLVDPDSGRFEIAYVPPGEVHLTVKSAGFVWTPRRDLRLDAREELDLGEISLQRGGRLVVRFDGAVSARALDGMHLSILTERREPTGAMTRVGDEFRSGPLPEGELRLLAQAPFAARVDRVLEVEPGIEKVVTLTLQSAGACRVVIETPPRAGQGDAPRGLWLSLRDSTGRLCWQYTGAGFQREVQISALPGTYQLIGGTSSGLRLESTLTITGFEGNQPPLRVTLLRGQG